MQNQPMQIDKKEFKELLKEIQKYNKLDLLLQGFQTKYAKEAVGVDDEQRRKDAIKTNELLESILLALSGTKDKASAKVVSIGAARRAREKNEEDRPRTFQDVKKSVREDLSKFKGELKTGVALTKRVGGGIGDAVRSFVRSPLESMKSVGSSIADFGKSAYGQAKDVLSTPSDYKNPMIAALQRPSTAAVDNPNIVDSPAEKVAEENEKQSASIKELLDVTKESLDQLKAIRGSLEGAPATRSAQPASKTPPAPVAPAPAAAEEGGSVIGDIAGAATSGIGGKIMGGLKAGGAMLGKGALAAGKMIGGAALAKPALIAAGVGLAAYGAYKGYKALTGGSDAKGAEGGQAGGGEGESTRVETIETSTISLEKFAQNDPKGFEEYQKFIHEETRKGQKQIAEDFKSGKKKGARESFLDKLERDVQERAIDKFKDKMMAAGAMETKTSVKGGVKGKESTGDKSALEANQVGALKSDSLEQKTYNSGYKETAPVSSKGGYGDKIGSFFGGIKDSVVGAAGKVGAAVSSKVDFIKDQYNRDLGATDATNQLRNETEKRAKAAGVEGFSDEYNKIKDQVQQEMVAKDPRAFEKSGGMGSTSSKLLISEDSDKSGTFQKSDLSQGVTDQKSIFGSTLLGTLFSKKGQKTGEFISNRENFEKFTGDAAALNLGSDLGVDSEKLEYSSLMGERISSGSMFKRDKYKVTDTMSGQKLNMSKSEYNKMQALVKEGKAEEAKKMFDEINAREAAYVPEAGITPEEQMVAPSPGSSNLAAVKDMKQNAELRDQMAATSKTSTPVVSNNVQTNNTTAFMPAKADPRPTHKGSALERYNDRIGVY